MSRYIDADKLLFDIEKYHLSDGKFQHWVEVQPTADVVEVVRCKDCKYGHQYANDKVHCSLGNDMYAYRPNDYCSYGERREDAT